MTLNLGIAEGLFWRCTAQEIRALFKARADRDEAQERRAVLRAGLVAAAIYNVHLKPGARRVRPDDFLAKPVKILKPEEMAAMLTDWLKDPAEA